MVLMQKTNGASAMKVAQGRNGNLFAAHAQWAKRPADERFASVDALRSYVDRVRLASEEKEWSWRSLLPFTVESTSGGVVRNELRLKMVGTEDESGALNNWSFGQLCARLRIPASYLRTLPPKLAAECIRDGLDRTGPDAPLATGSGTAGVLLAERKGWSSPVIRAITSDTYSRVWNSSVCEMLERMRDNGFMVPPARPSAPGAPGSRPATQDDVIAMGEFALSVRVGDTIAPAGLYAGDRDMFAFMVDPHRVINDGTEGGLRRGFFLWNSEVGAASVGLCTFLWRHVCGNHIVWGAKDVRMARVVHAGENAVGRYMAEAGRALAHDAETSAQDIEMIIARAKKEHLGRDSEETCEVLMKRVDLTRPVAVRAIDTAFENEAEDGSPFSVWGISNAFTRISQASPYADERTTMDRLAGRVLDLVAN